MIEEVRRREKKRTIDENHRLVQILILLNILQVTQLSLRHSISGSEFPIVEGLARESVDFGVEAILNLEHPSHLRSVQREKAGEKSQLEVGRECEGAAWGVEGGRGDGGVDGLALLA